MTRTIILDLSHYSLSVISHGINCFDNEGKKIGHADIAENIIYITLDEPKFEEQQAERKQREVQF